MYPELYTFTLWNISVPVMTFWLALTLSFALFYWMLWRLGKKYSLQTSFFSADLLLYVFVTFFVARLAHVLLYYGISGKSAFSIEYFITSFFFVSDFYFSLGGAVVWFFGIFLFLFRKKEKEDMYSTLDIVVISWLFASIVWFLWAFFWGQTYGILSESFWIDYTNNPILAAYKRFPLALIYFIGSLFIFSLTYITKKLRPEVGLASSVWALLWWIVWFLCEWWNDASSDNISSLFGLIIDWKFLNFNQYIALVLIVWGVWRLAHIIPSPISTEILRYEKFIQIFFRKSRKNISWHIKKIRKSIGR